VGIVVVVRIRVKHLAHTIKLLADQALERRQSIVVVGVQKIGLIVDIDPVVAIGSINCTRHHFLLAGGIVGATLIAVDSRLSDGGRNSRLTLVAATRKTLTAANDALATLASNQGHSISPSSRLVATTERVIAN
jgi:hypothetical protein